MARAFKVPNFYRSDTIAQIKLLRRTHDPKRRDFSPSELNFGPLVLRVARHFGFCFGVENAIEIAYRAVEENPGKRIFLLSEMIHNPDVNADLEQRGVKFLMSPDGTEQIPFDSLKPDDIVIVPAFGTTVQLQGRLSAIGIDPYYYDTTCPFVEKVWRRAEELGRDGFTVVVHGKRTHEETRATFSHSECAAPTLVILDMSDAIFLVDYISGTRSTAEFWDRFANGVSDGFDPQIHLKRIGVVNQTTMLATETHAIAETIRSGMLKKYGAELLKEHFADTRDTLCYATNENQNSTKDLIKAGADMAVVVGGYNSSNTSHLVELCEESMPTFYVKNAGEIINEHRIRHFDLQAKDVIETEGWLPPATTENPLIVAITSGASCPDRTVDDVITRIAELIPGCLNSSVAVENYRSRLESTLSIP
ncbi:MAG: 4-hydroxy-3-methylbut-2-enyl diphosphate reductase [Bdellovibrionales bacterium]|nr:4-hydroxy-3-methylbut-2-enyl diphosphate reductase [Bdellovibrionales bacterium]